MKDNEEERRTKNRRGESQKIGQKQLYTSEQVKGKTLTLIKV